MAHWGDTLALLGHIAQMGRRRPVQWANIKTKQDRLSVIVYKGISTYAVLKSHPKLVPSHPNIEQLTARRLAFFMK